MFAFIHPLTAILAEKLSSKENSIITKQKSSKKLYFFSNVGLWCFRVQKNLAVNIWSLERGLAVQTWTSNRKPDGKALVTWLLDVRGSREMPRKNLNLKVSNIVEKTLQLYIFVNVFILSLTDRIEILSMILPL